MVCAVVVLFFLLLASPAAAFYERGSHVLILNSTRLLPAIHRSSYLWLIGQ